jgi:predicted DNA-binding transcriptional regulator AlpA
VTNLIDPGELVDATEVADMLGLSQRSAVSVYRARYDDFPAPVVAKSRCVLWRRSDIAAWRDRTSS